MTSTELEMRASRQLADYDAHTPGTMFAQPDFALTVEEAYALQIETCKLRSVRGDVVAGYKIGCVSPIVQKQLGVGSPVFGHVFRSEIRDDDATLSASEFSGLAIEGEFAVELARDVQDPEDIRLEPESYVASVFPVIELHNFGFCGDGPSAAELIANNALHAGIVASRAALPSSPGSDLEIEVSINGSIRDSTTHNPLWAIATLAQMLSAFGIPLSRGQLLLTGSPLPLYPVNAGDCIEVRCVPSARVCASVSA